MLNYENGEAVILKFTEQGLFAEETAKSMDLLLDFVVPSLNRAAEGER